MSNVYELMTDAELDEAIRQLEGQADEIRARGLSLDMARGKPSVDQTNLSRPMLDLLTSESDNVRLLLVQLSVQHLMWNTLTFACFRIHIHIEHTA